VQRFEYEFHDDTGNGIAPRWGAVLTVAVLAPETFTRLMVATEAYIGAVAATIRGYLSYFCFSWFSWLRAAFLQRCTPHHMIRANVQLIAKTI